MEVTLGFLVKILEHLNSAQTFCILHRSRPKPTVGPSEQDRGDRAASPGPAASTSVYLGPVVHPVQSERINEACHKA